MEFYHHFSKIEYFIPRNNLGDVQLDFLVKTACFAWCICWYANTILNNIKETYLQIVL